MKPSLDRAAAYDAITRKHFHQFLERCFRTLNGDEPFLPNWHLEAMSHVLEQARTGTVRRLIINVPPRSLKSITASVTLSAFILGHDPSARIICVSYAKDLAADFSRAFRTIVESPWYRRIFPEMILAKNTEGLIETTRGGKRMATSIEGVVTGFGADFIIIDDPMQPNDAVSELEREKVIRYYRKTLFSRLNRKISGRVILVMQRIHEEDLTGYLLRTGGGKWKHLCIPAIATCDTDFELPGGAIYHRPAGEVLHAAFEPKEALDELRQELTSSDFEALYQQNPFPEEGNMVKADWIQYFVHPPSREDAQIIQSWDTAFKGDAQHDYSVCTTWLELGGHHYLLDVFRKKLDFPALLKAAVDLYLTHRPDTVLIEEQGSGLSMLQTLKQSSGVPTVGRRSKDDKKTRLNSVLALFEGGRVSFPQDAPWLADLLHELHAFPDGRFDDQVDSISQYLIWARERSYYGTFSYDFLSGITEAAPETPLWYPEPYFR